MLEQREYEIRDPIYGFIVFNDLEKAVIDHLAFQRLRRIRQLALTNYVYPGAMHTRFEHSLGVMHLASLMFDSIVGNEQNLEVLNNKLKFLRSGLDRVRQLIRLAALCHDLGHGPFSHVSERLMPSQTSRVRKKRGRFRHEDYTAAVIRRKLRPVIEGHAVNVANFHLTADEVAGLVVGSPVGQNLFWRLLISGQLDADRGDYLLRDSHHLGVKYGVYDYHRLVGCLALGIDPDSGEVVLGVNEGGWHVAVAVIVARYQMFTQVYHHKTRRAYDYHLSEALRCILPGGVFPPPKKIDAFLDLDDNSAWSRIVAAKGDECRPVLTRHHIRSVYETPELPKPVDFAALMAVKSKLQKAGIWFYEDAIDKAWYRTAERTGVEGEIMVIPRKTGRAKPLSQYSEVVKYIGGTNMSRLYVKEADRKRAEEVLT